MATSQRAIHAPLLQLNELWVAVFQVQAAIAESCGAGGGGSLLRGHLLGKKWNCGC
jgi:hypothetical protein